MIVIAIEEKPEVKKSFYFVTSSMKIVTSSMKKCKEKSFVAVDLEKSDIYPVEDFCELYITIDLTEKEYVLERCKQLNFKYVIYTKHFAFGSSVFKAFNNLKSQLPFYN